MSDAAWIILTGALAAGASSLLGCYLMLRKLSLIGDAISHAVLPGIALAFILTASRAPVPMLIGAGAFGVLAAFFIESLNKAGRVQEDAAIGITFTTLFSIGVILITVYGRNVDLDQECVLFGEIAYVPWDLVTIAGREVPRAPLMLGAVFLADLAFVLLLWKELLFCSFDPQMARAVGLRTTLVHYLLMAMVSLTVVAAFEAVGAILIVAMLIVPAATAYLLTERLGRMLAIALVVSAVAAAAGYGAARAADGPIAPWIATAAGGIFALALLFAPGRGIVVRSAGRAALAVRIAIENLVGELRAGEAPLERIAARFGWRPRFASVVVLVARRRGLVEGPAAALRLTERGVAEGGRLLDARRAWEEELGRLGYDREHAEASAHRLEHHAPPGALRAPGESG